MTKMSITKSWLSLWFINNYVQKCSQHCPHNLSRLFVDGVAIAKLQNAISAILDWRLSSPLTRDMLGAYHFAIGTITWLVSNNSVTVRSVHSLLNHFATISASLRDYIISVVFLRVAKETSRTGTNDELMDVLAETVGLFTGSRRYSSQRSSSLALSKAAKLMEIVANNAHSSVQLIEIEQCKAYLYRA